MPKAVRRNISRKDGYPEPDAVPEFIEGPKGQDAKKGMQLRRLQEGVESGDVTVCFTRCSEDSLSSRVLAVLCALCDFA